MVRDQVSLFPCLLAADGKKTKRDENQRMNESENGGTLPMLRPATELPAQENARSPKNEC